jgi:arylsulfatase A-like enzyme
MVLGGSMVSALGGCAYPPYIPQPEARPNVILIMTDDQGYGDLGFHGNDKIRTPHLDRLAGESAQMTQFYVCPVCSPTRASLMTGRYNFRTGVVDTYLGRSMMHAEEVTLAEWLRKTGYHTGIFGKWHLGDNPPLRACDQGFMESLVHNGGGIGQPSDPPGNRYFDPLLSRNGKRGTHEGYCTDIFFNEAIRFIEKNRERPFFAYIATNAPHTPLQIDDSYVEPYRAMGLNDTTSKIYGMITNIDENMGRLLARLKELDLEKDTIVIFLTDNGPQQERYNAGLRGRKGTVYEGGIRVPCFIRWPAKIKAGKRIDRIAAHIDILPTVLDACRIRIPATPAVDGLSLHSLLTGEGGDWPDRALFFQWHRGDEPEAYRQCAVRTQQYKLVNGEELYELAADPGEGRDISAEHPEVVKGLRRAYDSWLEDVSATRGYAPPRIDIGSAFENPVTLTRQDWRGRRAGWGKRSLGHWEVNVTHKGRYAVTLRFDALEKEVSAHFKLGDVAFSRSLEKGADSCTFDPVPLEARKGRLEAWLASGEESVGVHYVDVKRL